ncbi:hypothetical protein [Roseomonas sp. KE0001]|uniref:hypothetical protein n=1 Tax=unclassified Roseomonas TaxID=2617492 RepID=UPI0018E03226|nr:hypothetical protein [Roseomonas sp. KE0001]MBI0434384.1 hypothetical protein [Roseomonas sp. KE0001]
MSEYFPDLASRALWYARRATFLDLLQQALDPLPDEGLERTVIRDWALWARLGRQTADVTTSVPYSGSEVLAVLMRLGRETGFGPGQPILAEARLRYRPGEAELTAEGRATAEALAARLAAHLSGAASPPGRTGRGRRVRQPSRRSLALRAAMSGPG